MGVTAHRKLSFLTLFAAIAVAMAAPTVAADVERAIALNVDATDVTRGIFRVRETVPITQPGQLVLLYPKWLPGYHAPAGPIDKLGGMTISAQGKSLAWQRDPNDVYAFHVEVPTGATEIAIEFQYLSPVMPQQGRIVTTDDMLALEWHTVVLYPQGNAADHINVAASVSLPQGWSYATSLDAVGPSQGGIRFQPVSLEALVDSPLYAGRHFQRIALDAVENSSRAPSVWLNVFADRAAQLELNPERIAAHRRLVHQADLLFGARPFARYEFIVTLSDRLGGYGLEHRRSSENSISAAYLLDWDRSLAEERTLLPHEYVHSWNGKFRRSAGLLTPHYHAPVSDTMLWMYEGLTEYLGWVLAARSGLRTQQQTLEALAALAAFHAHRAGREWRNLSDTTNDPIIGRNAPLPWPNWQRGGDYYPEGPLFWLDIDTRIRELSKSHRSLDDFVRLFFGQASATAAPSPYDFEAIVAALNQVQPYDWSAHLRQRLTSHESPLDGLERGGWELTYRTEQTAYGVAVDGKAGATDFNYSLGFTVGQDAVLREVLWGSPAYESGLVIGTRLVAVDGIACEVDELKRAISVARDAQRPIELLVQNGNRYRTVRIDYRGGLRFPHLQRIAATSDVLGRIFAARR
jgi:predicted metalloprotease with PDZ domain